MELSDQQSVGYQPLQYKDKSEKNVKNIIFRSNDFIQTEMSHNKKSQIGYLMKGFLY